LHPAKGLRSGFRSSAKQDGCCANVVPLFQNDIKKQVLFLDIPYPVGRMNGMGRGELNPLLLFVERST
jgi:hypothetical protein